MQYVNRMHASTMIYIVIQPDDEGFCSPWNPWREVEREEIWIDTVSGIPWHVDN